MFFVAAVLTILSGLFYAAGRHEITLTNRTLGYREARTIDITAGKTMTMRIDPPKAAVSVNARPWADVTFDGNGLGQTPIASVLTSSAWRRGPRLGAGAVAGAVRGAFVAGAGVAATSKFYTA